MKLKQPFRILGVAAVAGIVGALSLGSPANAEDTTTIELKTAHQNQTADSAEFEQKCGEDAQIPADKPADYDGWVFILPDRSGDKFESVTATFLDGNGDQQVLEATVVAAGNSGSAKHAYVGAPAGWTLVTAVADVVGSDSASDTFNVTHTCPATPGEEETTPVEETTSPGEQPSEPGEESSPVCEEPSTPAESETPCEEATSPAGNANLPTTGTPLTIALVSAAALAAGGAVLFMIQRRRREAQDW